MATRGVNKVIIVGNVGGDPETRTFQSGDAITSISVATSEHWKNRQTGADESRTEWHRVVLRDMGNYKMAKYAAEQLKKGSKVYIEGKLQTRKYQAQDGSDRYVTEIIAEQFQCLDRREEGQQPQQSQQSYQQASQPAHQRQAPAQQAPAPNMNDFDDDIPF